MTPIGACLGVYLGTAYDEGSEGANLIRGSLTAFSAGIFIYISLVEILAEEFPQRPHHEKEGRIMFLHPYTLVVACYFVPPRSSQDQLGF
mmetsp:Transcript_44855/g.174087  ORF Transcript_44855/g.174087 Transcript_44855/m.174087 type:complete len:90 (-) Transcript_44855:692-961(-)